MVLVIDVFPPISQTPTRGRALDAFDFRRPLSRPSDQTATLQVTLCGLNRESTVSVLSETYQGRIHCNGGKLKANIAR